MAIVKDKFFNLFHDPSNPYTLFPIHNHQIWEMYKKSVASFWTPEEIDFSKDREQWNTLSNDERTFIKSVLAFFAASDGIVSENLDINFTQGIDVREVKCFYRFQNMIEDIHSETYSLMIETFITDPTEKANALNAINTMPCVKKKADWSIKWTQSSTAALPTKIFAFVIVEGLFFSGAFASIYWLKGRNLMPGLTFSNELISRDEGMHTDFAVLLYSMLEHKLSVDMITTLIREAVEIEKEFIIESIPCALIGMNSKLMGEYIEFVADRLVQQLGYPKIFKTANPFDFMELISITGKTNFFERRVGEYSLSGVGDGDLEDDEFGMDGAF